MSRKCIMGCPPGKSLHKFPKNPARRAEWFRILGFSTKTKNIYLCGAHIHRNYINGKTLSRYAIPYPRGQKIPFLKVSRNVHVDDETQFDTTESTSTEVLQVKFKPGNVDGSQNHTLTPAAFELCDLDNANPILNPEVNFKPGIVDEPQNHTLSPAVFELCDPDNGNPVLNGCFFENDEFIMTSYTSKSKLTHKEQVMILKQKYEKQTKYLERLKRENHSLVKTLRRQEVLFSQLRKIKAKNQTLRKGIKKYEKISRKLGKSLKEKN